MTDEAQTTVKWLGMAGGALLGAGVALAFGWPGLVMLVGAGLIGIAALLIKYKGLARDGD